MRFQNLSRLRLGLVGALVAATVAIGAPGQAAYPQSEVVTEDADDATAQVVATGNIQRPTVDVLASSNGTVYLAGLFEAVADDAGTHARRYLAAVDEASGQVRPFAPDVSGRVYALATNGDSVYLGGTFKTVNGISRGFLTKVDAVTGAVDTSFRPGIRGRVNDLAISRGMLFVGGAFSKRLVALDLATGADTGYVDLGIAGAVPNQSGPTSVFNFSVDPAGEHLVAVGNFATVSGSNRLRTFMADLDDDRARVSPWYYAPLAKRCITNTRTKQAQIADVDFSPDGSYFVLAATGYVPYRTSEIGETICDASARFDTNEPNPNRPKWINYTGGDTVWSVAVTGKAVYVQGHFRWLDNPYGKDSLGPGGVRRPGIGAIDPVTGKALDWNPAKPAQIGGKAFLATPSGLWVGSDSPKFAGEPHRGLAFVPLP